MTPQTAARNDGLRAWLRDKAGVAVRFLDDVVEVLRAEQVDGPEDLAFFATTPAFDAKLTATTAVRIRAVLATEAAPSVAATCAPVDQEATQLLTRCTHSLHESDGGKAASSVAPELAADTALAVATPPVLCAQAPSAAIASAIAPAGGPSQEEIVYLSVGGTPLTTRRSTLCRVPTLRLPNCSRSAMDSVSRTRIGAAHTFSTGTPNSSLGCTTTCCLNAGFMTFPPLT